MTTLTSQVVVVAANDNYEARVKIAYVHEPGLSQLYDVVTGACETFTKAFPDNVPERVTATIGPWEPDDEDYDAS